ncbi:hypothetical protein [Streptomyces sp. NPDC005795]|uniref:hypothetical protein n=1 Tax=Streptomyces sp. NPDC005795 TaxID=3154677 RepID=UPI0033D1C5DD
MGGTPSSAERAGRLDGVDRFLGQSDIGGMPAQMVRASIERFGDLVAPAVHHVLAS